jgi:hypothetical protein
MLQSKLNSGGGDFPAVMLFAGGVMNALQHECADAPHGVVITAVTETRIGATTYTVERDFRPDARENALQAIERLLLQKARSDGREKIFDNRLNPLAIRKNQR